MIINILNNGSIVALSIFTKSSYDGWIGWILVTHPFVNELTPPPPPHLGLSHNLCKNISFCTNIPDFGSPYPLPYVTGVGVQTMHLLPSKKPNI